MSKENQKEKIKKRIREKTPKKICAIRERFLILSSVAAGSQSAMQQWEWRMKNEELTASPIKKQGSAAGGKANEELSASPIKNYRV